MFTSLLCNCALWANRNCQVIVVSVRALLRRGRGVLWTDGVGTFTKAKPAQKLNAVPFFQSATPSTKHQRLVAAYG
jgi:hypothetical protein